MDYIKTRELYHHGIKGMRWGQRNYQNADGSLTPEGKKRYAKELQTVRKEHQEAEKARQQQAKQAGKRYTYQPLKKADEGKEVAKEVLSGKMDNAESLLRDTSDALNKAAQLFPSGGGKSVHGDYSKISDDELRRRVNRLNMEEQYARLTGDNKYVKSGGEITREILQTTGAIAGIGTAAVGIAYTIMKMLGKAK